MEFEKIFRALGDKHRIYILDLLMERDMSAGELLQLVDVVQSTLSHHMKSLCESGLVIPRKEKLRTYYTVSRETVEMAREFLKRYLAEEVAEVPTEVLAAGEVTEIPVEVSVEETEKVLTEALVAEEAEVQVEVPVAEETEVQETETAAETVPEAQLKEPQPEEETDPIYANMKDSKKKKSEKNKKKADKKKAGEKKKEKKEGKDSEKKKTGKKKEKKGDKKDGKSKRD